MFSPWQWIIVIIVCAIVFIIAMLIAAAEKVRERECKHRWEFEEDKIENLVIVKAITATYHRAIMIERCIHCRQSRIVEKYPGRTIEEDGSLTYTIDHTETYGM
jgi:hypothetical protein